MSIYEEFINLLQKEFGIKKKLPKPLKVPKPKVRSAEIPIDSPLHGSLLHGLATGRLKTPGPVKVLGNKRSIEMKSFGVEKKLPKPLKGQKIVRPEKIIDVPKPLPKPKKSPTEREWFHSPTGKILGTSRAFGTQKIIKGGQGSGRKASSSSKLAAPKRGSPIKVAISRYQKRPSPSLHQKVVEAFRGKERKKTKIEDPLKGLKHPWD